MLDQVRNHFEKITINCGVHGVVEALAYRPSCRLCAEQRWIEDQARLQAERDATERRECIEAALQASGLIGRFHGATLDNFEATDAKQHAAVNAARRFADGAVNLAWGALWLLGKPGTGKTHLASGVVRHVIRQHHPLTAAIRTVGEIVTEHRALWDQRERDKRRLHNESARGGVGRPSLSTTTDELAAWLGGRSLLAIDDLGATRLGDPELEVLFHVVDLRYRACLPTVITSNLPAAVLAEQLGARLTDRLQENATIVACTWPSHRQGPLNRTAA